MKEFTFYKNNILVVRMRAYTYGEALRLANLDDAYDFYETWA